MDKKIGSAVGGGQDGMMDIATIRYNNLLVLLAEFQTIRGGPERGLLKSFGESVGISDRQLSHMKCKNRDIGAQTARKIERGLNLHHGWMDVAHGGSEPETESEKDFIDAAIKLYRENPLLAHQILLKLIKDK